MSDFKKRVKDQGIEKSKTELVEFKAKFEEDLQNLRGTQKELNEAFSKLTKDFADLLFDFGDFGLDLLEKDAKFVAVCHVSDYISPVDKDNPIAQREESLKVILEHLKEKNNVKWYMPMFRNPQPLKELREPLQKMARYHRCEEMRWWIDQRAIVFISIVFFATKRQFIGVAKQGTNEGIGMLKDFFHSFGAQCSGCVDSQLRVHDHEHFVGMNQLGGLVECSVVRTITSSI